MNTFVHLFLEKNSKGNVVFYRRKNTYYCIMDGKSEIFMLGKEDILSHINQISNARVVGDKIVKCGYSKKFEDENPAFKKFRRMNVKKWYMEVYPTDDYANECLDDKLTFGQFCDRFNDGEDVYDILGLTDSLVRERIFRFISENLGISYDTIYNSWLVMGNASNRKMLTNLFLI